MSYGLTPTPITLILSKAAKAISSGPSSDANKFEVAIVGVTILLDGTRDF